MSLDKNSIVILNQYSFEDIEWPGHDLYESILVALKEKYSDRLVFRLHPEVHWDPNNFHITKSQFNIKFAKKHNLKIEDGTERLTKFIRNNVDNIKAIYSIDSSGILISLKYNIPTYHLFGMFISNKIFHPINKVDNTKLFGWTPTSTKEYNWEKSFLVKDNKLYLNITDLSQIGSIDDVVYDVNTKSGLKWEDLKWD
jgi:uncharacterized protein YjbK